MHIYLFTLVVLCSNIPNLYAQEAIVGIGTYWSDSFEEWVIYTETETVEGFLQPRWAFRNDWTAWEWELGDERVQIEQAWKNDPTQWKVRGYNGDMVTCRAMWKNDLTEWKVTNNTYTLTLRPRWSGDLNVWEVREKTYGTFEIYTTWENDPRDWTIINELDERISPNMHIALIFLAIYHSSPKQ